MSIVFPEAADAIWAAMRAGTTDKAWFILSINPDDKKKLELTASGRCGLRHIKRFLQDDQVRRVALVSTAFERSMRTLAVTCDEIGRIIVFFILPQIHFGAFRIFALEKSHKAARFCLFTFKGSKAPLKLKTAAGNIASPFVKRFEVCEGCEWAPRRHFATC
jgi:hypothetical protein